MKNHGNKGVYLATAVMGAFMAPYDTALADAATGNAAAEKVGLEEVIVTAQKRVETAQTTALALDVVSGQELVSRGVSQPQDLEKLVPGLKMTNAPTTQIYIRGVGENSGTSLGQSAVAVNTDGVYVGRVTAVAGNFYDLERVEVLKGPQGTLYGRNASGGAVNIISNKPTQELGGNFQAEVGSYELQRISGALNVPVTDQFALRGAIYASKRDGYLSDGSEDEDVHSGRLHALWKPSEAVSLLVTVDASRVGGIGSGAAFVGQGLTSARQGSVADTLRPLALVDTVSGTIPIPRLSPQARDFRNSGARAQLDWDLGWATLVVLPGYKKQDYSYTDTELNGSNSSQGHSEQYSGEVRLGHQSRKVKWSAGAYYFNESVDFSYHGQYVFFEVAPFHVYSTVNNYFQVPDFGTKSTAAFGELTYSFTDRFRGIFGLRYTSEKRNEDLRTQWYGENFNIPGYSTIATNPLTGLTGTTACNQSGCSVVPNLYVYNNLESLKFGSTTGKVGFEFDVADDSLLFATIATGFKSGGFSLSPPPQSTFQPEKLTAYTVGWKNRFLANRLQLNGEAFYWDYTNQQISHQAPDINGAQGFITENAGKTKIYGAEMDVLFAPSTNDRLGLQAQYLSAKFDKFLVVTGFPSSGDGCTYAPTTVFGRNAFTKDCQGLRAPYAPEWTGMGGYSHTFNLSNGRVIFNGSVRFASDQATDVTTDPRFTAHGYALYDADIGFQSNKKAWGVTAYVRNLTNRIIYNDNIQSVDFAKATDFQTSLIPASLSLKSDVLPPRTYGLRIDVTF